MHHDPTIEVLAKGLIGTSSSIFALSFSSVGPGVILQTTFGILVPALTAVSLIHTIYKTRQEIKDNDRKERNRVNASKYYWKWKKSRKTKELDKTG